jgi:hypothetical protein
MLIDLCKLAPAAFVGACIACGAQEITGWKYGFVLGLAAWAYCLHLMHLVTATCATGYSGRGRDEEAERCRCRRTKTLIAKGALMACLKQPMEAAPAQRVPPPLGGRFAGRVSQSARPLLSCRN